MMRDSNLSRWSWLSGVALGAALAMSSAASAQITTSNTQTPNLGFANPAQQTPSTVQVWNPFAQAANAIQNAFTSKPDPYRMPTTGDPTRLETGIPEISGQVRLQAARLAYSRGRIAEAKANYELVLKSDPKHLESLISLARIADSQAGFKAARPLYVAALNAHPQRAAVHNDFGMSAARNQQMDIALMAFAEAVRLEPKNVRYRNNAAKALLQAGRWREALEQLVAAHPPAAAHYNFAFLLDQIGGPNEQILFHARQALRFDKSFVAAQQLAETVSQRQLALKAASPTPGRAFLPQNAASTANARPAPYETPSQASRPQAPPQGYRQSRRMPPVSASVNDTMFPPQSNPQRPVYLPPAAPSWPRR